jgi:hypothetical protein
MAKSRERKVRDIIQVKCIKDKTTRLLTKYEDIKNMWREYFDKLFNKGSGNSSIELDISSDELNKQFVHRIQESVVKNDFKRIKGQVLETTIVWLTKLSNLIFQSNKITDEWSRAFKYQSSTRGMCKVVQIIEGSN